jgi:hypothetical protein
VIVTAHDISPIEIPLQASENVDRLGLIGRLKAAATYIFLGPPAPTGGSTAPAVDAPLPKAAPAKTAAKTKAGG